MPCPLIQEIETRHTPESLTGRLHAETGTILLRSGTMEHGERFSLVAARPFLRFESYGSRCEIESAAGRRTLFGSPWKLLESLANRYELLEEIDLPFPLGGCFGYFGYELKQFVEPHLPLTTHNDLELPECSVGFYDSLVVFDHKIDKAWLISTGLGEEGDRSDERAQAAAAFWLGQLGTLGQAPAAEPPLGQATMPQVTSTMSRESYCDGVRRIIDYIWRGDIYQANLTHRLAAEVGVDGWTLFQRLATASPAPFSAFMQCGDFQLASSSPEQFLRLSGDHVTTRPIKGTRPRGTSPDLDARLGYELQTSAKDRSELVMITDLLRNDLGRFCEYGSVTVPDLAKLERFAQVQHLVSTVAGRLRPGVTHLHALASCFPGGSITGAPKIRAMEIIDELEPVVRGPYSRMPRLPRLQPREPVQHPDPHGGLPGWRGVVSRWRRHRRRLRSRRRIRGDTQQGGRLAGGAEPAGVGIALVSRNGVAQPPRVTGLGTILNTACILLGGLAGLFIFRNISAKTQQNLKLAIALVSLAIGFMMIWGGLAGSYPGQPARGWLMRVYLFIVVMLSLGAGKWLGGKIGIQRRLNSMGAWARKKFTAATQKEDEKHPPSEGFVTCTLLFCVGPMSLLGPIQDGLTGDIEILAIKSVMDGISTMTFATTFGWSVLFSAVPVLVYQGTLTLLAVVVKQWLDAMPEAGLLIDSVTATGGFIVLCIPLLLLEIRRIQLADYLPALVIAPAAVWTFLR